MGLFRSLLCAGGGHLVSIRLMQLDSPGTMPIEFCPLSPGARAGIRKGLINTWGFGTVRSSPCLVD